MKKGFFIAGSMLLSLAVQAQNVGGNAPSPLMNINLQPLGTIQEIDLAGPTPRVQHFYLSQDWKIGQVYIKGGEFISGHPMRVDLLNEVIEFKSNDQVHVLSQMKVDSLIYHSVVGERVKYVTSIPGKEFRIPWIGMYRVLREKGDWQLLRKEKVIVLKPSYNRVLDAGTKEERPVLKAEYFLVNRGDLVAIEKSKKRFLRNFPALNQPLVKEYLKQNKIKLSREEDLLKLVAFLNAKP